VLTDFVFLCLSIVSTYVLVILFISWFCSTIFVVFTSYFYFVNLMLLSLNYTSWSMFPSWSMSSKSFSFKFKQPAAELDFLKHQRGSCRHFVAASFTFLFYHHDYCIATDERFIAMFNLYCGSFPHLEGFVLHRTSCLGWWQVRPMYTKSLDVYLL